MTITLSADDHLIERAKAAAAARGTTLDELVQDYIRQLADNSDLQAAADEFVRNALERPGHPDPDWKLDRSAVHDRTIR